jgi:hypothetical protein
MTQDAILGYFYLRNELLAIRQPTQDDVLGHSQPSLRDSIWTVKFLRSP